MKPKKQSPFETAWRQRDSRARKKKREEPANWVERERVAEVLTHWMVAQDAQNSATSGDNHTVVRGKTGLAELTGLNARTIYRLCDTEARSVCVKWTGNYITIGGQERFVSIYTLDQILTRIGWQHLLRTPPEKGGFSDVYLHESVIGDSDGILEWEMAA